MNYIKTCIYITILFLLVSCTGVPGTSTGRDTLPPLFPDIAGVTIPVNIAPMNFRLTEPVSRLVATFKGSDANLKIRGKEKILIPAGKWHKLLEENSGGNILVTLFAKTEGEWVRYKPFNIHVKETPIDQSLVYRLIAPGYESWSEMGIYQRDLTSFRETPVIDNRLLPGNCMNCHSFNNNDPEQMMFHLRGNIGGTMLVKNGTITRLNTKTDETISNCVYPYWHPSGNYIAYSVNLISQVFHTVNTKRIEVMDSESDVVVYDINANKLITTKLISSEESFETFPSFTPDGKTLIFCSARKGVLPDDYDSIKYSLCKISFDPSDGTFGTTVDTLVSSYSTGESISFPRPSHDGKFIMFTMSDYGNFSIWHKDADLYLLDLSTASYKNMTTVNSDDTDSYHSWSSDSQWFVFSSRRINGLYTMPYIAWLDENGEASKPFLLPQKDPDHYDNSLRSFNVPELVNGKITVTGREMLNTISSEVKNVTFELKD